jgi:Restriction endonuclease
VTADDSGKLETRSASVKTPSTYDKLHDDYLTGGGKKPGTRYERLMAVIQASLAKSNIVVHDINLTGAVSGEQHQIDVYVTDQLGSRRTLIECKDFDVAGKPVGIGIVRDFNGVVVDGKPDEAWIISCNGYTKNARKYAKAFGIKLAICRDFRETDWEGRIRKIGFTMIIPIVMSLSIKRVYSPREDLGPKLNAAFLASIPGPPPRDGQVSVDPYAIPITVNLDGARMPLGLFTNQKLLGYLAKSNTTDGQHTETVPFDNLDFDLGDAVVPVRALEVVYTLRVMREETIVEAPGIALLLLLRDDANDVVVFDTDIRSYAIDDLGNVVSSKSLLVP